MQKRQSIRRLSIRSFCPLDLGSIAFCTVVLERHGSVSTLQMFLWKYEQMSASGLCLSIRVGAAAYSGLTNSMNYEEARSACGGSRRQSRAFVFS